MAATVAATRAVVVPQVYHLEAALPGWVPGYGPGLVSTGPLGPQGGPGI